LEAAKSGTARTRSGDRYMPSLVRSYERTLTATVLPRLGSRRVSAVTRAVLQDLADRMVSDRSAPSTVHNTVLPFVRSIAGWWPGR